jgi:hypothetical protein
VHLELLLDLDSGLLTAWVLDAHCENFLRLRNARIDLILHLDGKDRPVTLKGVGSELTGETENDTSEFRAQMVEWKGMDAFEGTIEPLVVRGQAFPATRFTYRPDPEGAP